jgi:hypothetical protein
MDLFKFIFDAAAAIALPAVADDEFEQPTNAQEEASPTGLVLFCVVA